MLKKIITRIREGLLREIWTESKWIYGYAGRYRRGIGLYILLGLLSTAVGLGGSVASKYLIDAVTGRESGQLGMLMALYIGFSLGSIGLGAVTKRVNALISIRAQNEIRADVFRRFLDVDWEASLDYHSGDLLSRVSSDVNTVAGSVLGWVPSLFTGVVQFAAALAVIIVYDPLMALIALATAPLTVMISAWFLPQMRAFSRQVRERQAGLTAFYEESLQNLQAVKAFHMKTKLCGRLEALQELYRDASLDFNRFSVKGGALSSLSGFVVSGACLLWCAYRLWNGYISFGTMVLFIQLAGQVSSTFSALVGLAPSVISATVSAGRIMSILALPCESEALDLQTRQVMENAKTQGLGLRVENVHFAYRDARPVFRGLSFSAQPGEVIGIVSPSGGGKTTLVRLLLSLIRPTEGCVIFESGDAAAPACPALRGLLSYVAQEKAVFSGSVADFLRIGRENAEDAALEQALRAACAWDFVAALPEGLSTPLGERGAGLSEGQMQRLAIARAVLCRAPVMLLDEATSALDMATEHQVIRNLFSDGICRTVIVTTHRPTMLASCTRVYAIEEGKARILSAAEVAKALRGEE